MKVNKLLNGDLIIPVNYKSKLTLRKREEAIKFVKDTFQKALAKALRIQRVSAPIAILSNTGVNDHLNGIEKPASFEIKGLGKKAEIAQSLAKWKRTALSDYNFKKGEGLYTDMNAIRPDEVLDNMHSLYVDQWDWEKVITKKERKVAYLKETVQKIYGAITATEKKVHTKYPQLGKPFLPQKIEFIHSEELEEMYPHLSPKEREYAICKQKKAVFIIGIGGTLRGGAPHDGRAADYDDWSTPNEEGRIGLNGDIMVYYPVLDIAFELSSMGIRVDKNALVRQLKIKGEEKKMELDFHQKLINNELPLSIGGGIGQSRLCMLFLKCVHVGEVQSGIWSSETRQMCQRNGVKLL